jgi:hypothetical protein
MPGAVGEKLGPQHRHGWFGPSVDLTFHLLGSSRSEWVFARNLARHAGEGYASAEMALQDFGPDGNDEGRPVVYATQVCWRLPLARSTFAVPPSKMAGQVVCETHSCVAVLREPRPDPR